MVIQLARALTGLTVIGSASRDESRKWALDLGAHDVVDHHDLPEGVDYIFSPSTAGRIERFAEILRPGGAITAIDEPPGLDLLPLKAKSISFHWELMFTRSLFQTPDMIAQHELLDLVATWSTPARSARRSPPDCRRSARQHSHEPTKWLKKDIWSARWSSRSR